MSIQRIEEKGAVPIKIWTDYVEQSAMQKLRNVARLPFVSPHGVAAMADTHDGIGAVVGSVLVTNRAIIPAAVGVDIGCGMMAVLTSLTATDLPDSLTSVRETIEKAIPHGFVTVPGASFKGGWGAITPAITIRTWRKALDQEFNHIVSKHPKVDHDKAIKQLGSLGGGNHFIEVCLDEQNRVWIMLHSGSRGVGNRIGQYFIALAREDMRVHQINLPDKDLAYFEEGTKHFDDYIQAMLWAQSYAQLNREVMMEIILGVLRRSIKDFQLGEVAVNCHHNYATQEWHFGECSWVTRKGAVRAAAGELGIIPGSMGQKSYIVEGLGNPDSFLSCSHGAGRRMSRSQAKKQFTEADLVAQTKGVDCIKDKRVLDEIPSSYKNIEEVMENQKDLVKPKHILKQVLCVKGW